MRTTIQDLNSLRGIVRKLQEENETLKKLLEDNGIEYESEEIIDASDTPDDYDEDQGGRIMTYTSTLDMAKEFYAYFWGRSDVFAKRGKNGGYFPQLSVRKKENQKLNVLDMGYTLLRTTKNYPYRMNLGTCIRHCAIWYN